MEVGTFTRRKLTPREAAGLSASQQAAGPRGPTPRPVASLLWASASDNTARAAYLLAHPSQRVDTLGRQQEAQLPLAALTPGCPPAAAPGRSPALGEGRGALTVSASITSR